MARNPFAATAAQRSAATEVDYLARVLTTYLRLPTVAALRDALTAAGVAPGLVITVVVLDVIPDAALRALHPRLADPLVWQAVQDRLGLA